MTLRFIFSNPPEGLKKKWLKRTNCRPFFFRDVAKRVSVSNLTLLRTDSGQASTPNDHDGQSLVSAALLAGRPPSHPPAPRMVSQFRPYKTFSVCRSAPWKLRV